MITSTLSFDVFISYNSSDRDMAEAVAYRLRTEHGLSVWFDRSHLQGGVSWRSEIETAMNASAAALILWGPAGLGPVQLQERDLAYVVRDARAEFRVVPVFLPGTPLPRGTFANVDTYVAFSSGLDDDDAFRRLVTAIKGQAPDTAIMSDLPAHPAPYRGLAPFGSDEARFFFGRAGYINELATRVERDGFVALVGPSGAGKTSLLQAGYLASSHGKPVACPVLALKPGSRPIRALASAIARLSRQQDSLTLADSLAARLTAAPTDIAHVIVTMTPDGAIPVVAIDRLEEIFTLCDSEEERQSFVDAVMHLADDPHRVAHVILTLRADFYAHIGRYGPLAAKIATHQIYVGPIDDADVLSVILGPAAEVGALFEKGLALQVQLDARRADSHREVVLPLLQQTLDLLWRKRRGRWLTWDTYREIGGVVGALRYHADHVLERLTQEECDVAKRMLVRLVWFDETGHSLAGRPLDKTELVHQFEARPLAERVLERLADERLLVVRAEGSRAMAALVHDTLAVQWGRLREWVQNDRAFLWWRQRLDTVRAEWIRAAKDPSTLLRGPALLEAERWSAERGDDLSPEERSFIVESVASRDHEVSVRAAARRRLTMTAAGAALIVIASLAIGMYTTARQAAIAEQQRARADRRFNDVRHLARTFLFTFHDAIATLAGATGARQLVVNTAREYYDSLAQEATGDPSLQRELAGSYARLGTIQWEISAANLGDRKGALESQVKALELRKGLVAATPRDSNLQLEISQSHLFVGDLLQAEGRLKEALAHFERALTLRSDLAAREPENPTAQRELASAHEKVGAVLGDPGTPHNLGDFDAAMKHFETMVAILEQVIASHGPDRDRQNHLTYAYDHVADVSLRLGNSARALQLYEKSLAMTQTLVQEDPNNARLQLDIAYRHENLGNLLSRRNPAVALDHLRTAVAARERSVRLDPRDVNARQNLAVAHGMTGQALAAADDPSAAIESFRRALTVNDALLAQDPSSAVAQQNAVIILGELVKQTQRVGATRDTAAYQKRLLEALRARAATATNRTQQG